MALLSLQEEFYAWLKYHKEKWKLQLARRRERRLMAGQDSVHGGGSVHLHSSLMSGNLTGFLRQQNRTLVDLPWQIIQVICKQMSLTSR